MVSQRKRTLRGTNVKPAGGNHRAIPLQRAELTHRGQIGHLQFLRAAALDGMKMNRTAVRHSTGVAMRSHSSRNGSLRAGLRGTERSAGRSHHQNQDRHETGNPCQPSSVSRWHDASHLFISTLRACSLGVNLAACSVVPNKQGGLNRRSHAGLYRLRLCQRKSDRRR
jgi:hypothetical protein